MYLKIIPLWGSTTLYSGTLASWKSLNLSIGVVCRGTNHGFGLGSNHGFECNSGTLRRGI